MNWLFCYVTKSQRWSYMQLPFLTFGRCSLPFPLLHRRLCSHSYTSSSIFTVLTHPFNVVLTIHRHPKLKIENSKVAILSSNSMTNFRYDFLLFFVILLLLSCFMSFGGVPWLSGFMFLLLSGQLFYWGFNMKIWRCAAGLVLALLGWCFGCSDVFFPVLFSP